MMENYPFTMFAGKRMFSEGNTLFLDVKDLCIKDKHFLEMVKEIVQQIRTLTSLLEDTYSDPRNHIKSCNLFYFQFSVLLLS